MDSAPLVPGPSGASGGDSLPATKKGSSQATAFPPLPPEPPHASADCLSFVERSARHFGFSKAVAHQLTHCHCRSTHINYQAKWSVYRSWCHHHGNSVPCPTVSKVADFLLYLGRSLSLLLVYCFLPLYVEWYFSFCSSRPFLTFCSCIPHWDLLSVLRCLRGSPFEPLDSCSLHDLTQKALFLFSLATARRVSELQAVSSSVFWSGEDIYLSYLPEFRVKAESTNNPLPRSFCIRSLCYFVGNLLMNSCCAQFLLSWSTSLVLLLFLRVLVLSLYLLAHLLVLFLRMPLASSFVRLSLRLLPLLPRLLLPLLLLLLLLWGSARPSSFLFRAHSVRGVAASVAFARNAPLSSTLAAATWSSSSVFTSFYLRDVQFSSPQGFSLGSVVAAGAVV